MAAVIREIRSVEKWNQEWDCLEEEIANIKKAQYQRLQKAMDEYRSAQEALKKGLDGQEKKLKAFAFAMRKIQSNERNTEKEQLVSMATKINNMTRDFGDLQQGLPKKPGWFLRACLGSINVSLSWDKLHYKNNYENFKLRMTWISMMLILFNLLVFKNRFFDAIFHAVLVWYYSSLTLQEHILIANGSKRNLLLIFVVVWLPVELKGSALDSIITSVNLSDIANTYSFKKIKLDTYWTLNPYAAVAASSLSNFKKDIPHEVLTEVVKLARGEDSASIGNAQEKFIAYSKPYIGLAVGTIVFAVILIIIGFSHCILSCVKKCGTVPTENNPSSLKSKARFVFILGFVSLESSP
eukprot:gene15788-7088_t